METPDPFRYLKGTVMLPNENFHLMVFSCGENHYAIPSEMLVRVIRIVELTPIPETPHMLSGVFDFQGRTIPVISARRLFALGDKPVALEDMLVVIHTHGREMALMVDAVDGLFAFGREQLTGSDELFPDLILKGVVKWEGKLLPLIDMESLIGHEIFEHAVRPGDDAARGSDA